MVSHNNRCKGNRCQYNENVGHVGLVAGHAQHAQALSRLYKRVTNCGHDNEKVHLDSGGDTATFEQAGPRATQWQAMEAPAPNTPVDT